MIEHSRVLKNQQIDLSGKVVVVTGGAKGIGRVICSYMVAAGARTIIVDNDEVAGKHTVEEFNQAGAKARFVKCNITDEAEVKSTFTQLDKSESGVDVLVNNAGIYPEKPFLETEVSDLRQVLEINLIGTFICSRNAAVSMIARQRGGVIINIVSIEAERSSSPGMSAYGASKAGVVMLTKSLAKELGHHGIRVNAVSPGGIITPEIVGQLKEVTPELYKDQKAKLKTFLKRVPIGRMGEAGDVAGVVLFLASDLSSYITGETIRVDGGYLVS